MASVTNGSGKNCIQYGIEEVLQDSRRPHISRLVESVWNLMLCISNSVLHRSLDVLRCEEDYVFTRPVVDKPWLLLLMCMCKATVRWFRRRASIFRNNLTVQSMNWISERPHMVFLQVLTCIISKWKMTGCIESNGGIQHIMNLDDRNRFWDSYSL